MSPAKDLDPDRGRLRKLAWVQADLTLALANPRTRRRERICQQIIKLDRHIGRCRAAIARGCR
jgi:hypothetical protein